MLLVFDAGAVGSKIIRANERGVVFRPINLTLVIIRTYPLRGMCSYDFTLVLRGKMD